MVRERLEKLEKALLSPFACCAQNSRGRAIDELPCNLRTCFQRDRDRILHSKSFRRLKHKTQVLLYPKGDHPRTRLTHTLEVSQVARTIARALRMNEDLTEAISLGHDLGHTPFGHMGERSLRTLAKNAGLRGFHHAEQSLRVVDVLEKEGAGLNLSWEVRQGIIQHSKGQVDMRKGFELEKPSTIEAWIVRVSDSIAYLNHDLEDALSAEIITFSEIPSSIVEKLGATHSDRINTLITDVVSNSADERIQFSGEILEQIEILRQFLYSFVYASDVVRKDEPKVDRLLQTLFEYCTVEMKKSPLEAVDFISGMTDRYALRFFRQIAIPVSWPFEVN